MTSGEKMIWAAAFVSEMRDRRRVRIEKGGPNVYEIDLCESAVVASDTVDDANWAVGHTGRKGWPHDGAVMSRLKEMLND